MSPSSFPGFPASFWPSRCPRGIGCSDIQIADPNPAPAPDHNSVLVKIPAMHVSAFVILAKKGVGTNLWLRPIGNATAGLHLHGEVVRQMDDLSKQRVRQMFQRSVKIYYLHCRQRPGNYYLQVLENVCIWLGQKNCNASLINIFRVPFAR